MVHPGITIVGALPQIPGGAHVRRPVQCEVDGVHRDPAQNLMIKDPPGCAPVSRPVEPAEHPISGPDSGQHEVRVGRGLRPRCRPRLPRHRGTPTPARSKTTSRNQNRRHESPVEAGFGGPGHVAVMIRAAVEIVGFRSPAEVTDRGGRQQDRRCDDMDDELVGTDRALAAGPVSGRTGVYRKTLISAPLFDSTLQVPPGRLPAGGTPAPHWRRVFCECVGKVWCARLTRRRSFCCSRGSRAPCGRDARTTLATGLL